MSFCIKCGNAIDNDAKFCGRCGTPVPEDVTGSNQGQSQGCAAGNPSGASACTSNPVPKPQAHADRSGVGTVPPYQQTYQQQRGAGSIPNYRQPSYGQNGYYGAAYQPQTSPVAELSKKVKTEAIIWFCIAVYQIILGFVNLMLGDYAVATGLILFCIAGLNLYAASKDLQYSKDVLVNPVGIVEKYKPVTGLVVTLGYNLCFGGILGVIGSVFSFLTREYVQKNEAVFLNIEAQAVQ